MLALGAALLVYAAWFQFPDGIQALANGALRGLKDTFVPALVTTIAYWGVGFPVGWWLGLHRGLGAPGLWIGFIAGLTAAGAAARDPLRRARATGAAGDLRDMTRTAEPLSLTVPDPAAAGLVSTRSAPIPVP